jgi:hypothetical protein
MIADKEHVRINLAQSIEAKKFVQAYAQLPESSGDEATLENEDSGFVEKFPPNNNSLHGDSPDNSRIYLDLGRWRTVLETSATPFENQREKIKKILDYFIMVARCNNLQEIPAVVCLENALDALGERGDFTGTANNDWKRRISQRTVGEVESSLNTFLALEQGQGFNRTITDTSEEHDSRIIRSQRLFSSTDLYKAIPLFNIWDSISWIYTLCVEEIKDQLQAERHLFQLRTIVAALRDCEYFPNWASPPTVATAWADMGVDKPLLVVYATTCVGPKEKSDKTKDEMANLRCVFIKTLTARPQEAFMVIMRPPNRRGNCPEFVTWRVLCTESGKYSSLCFSTTDVKGKAKSLKFCGYCKNFADFLRGQRIHIDDLWDKALLCDKNSSAVTRGRYPFRLLQSMEEILNSLIDSDDVLSGAEKVVDV